MSNKRPRIAFCFSGQARTLDQTYLFFKKNLFDAAKEQGFDYDVFCAVEDDEDVDKVNLLNPTKVERIKSSEVEIIIDEKYGELIKTALKHNKRLNCSHEGIIRYLQQIYKVSRSINLCNNNCDIIIRLRFDVFLFNKLNFKNILRKIHNGKTLICNVPFEKMAFRLGLNFSQLREICDFYFIGNSKSMRKLENEFFEFEKIMNVFTPKHKFISYIYNKTIYLSQNINKTVGHKIIPINLLMLLYCKLGFKCFSPELFYYYFFINKGLKIEKTNISYIFLKKTPSQSDINLQRKTEYEI